MLTEEMLSGKGEKLLVKVRKSRRHWNRTYFTAGTLGNFVDRQVVNVYFLGYSFEKGHA